MTAKGILEAAAGAVPSLGIATVYRNIRNMLNSGELEQIDVPGLTSYFSLPRKKAQALAVCRKSQRVHLFDIEQAKLKALHNAPDSFIPDTVEVFLFGEFADSDSKPTMP